MKKYSDYLLDFINANKDKINKGNKQLTFNAFNAGYSAASKYWLDILEGKKL